MEQSFKRFSILMIVFSTLAGCSRSDRAILDQSQSLIDARKYPEAIALLEKEIPDHPTNELKTQLAFAYLGNSGIELLELANQVTFLKSFKSVEVKDQPLDKVCPQLPDTFDTSLSFVCLPIIKLNHFPEPDQADLLKSLAIFNEIDADPATTDHDINLLLAIVQMGIAIKNYDHLVVPPAEFDNSNIQNDRNLQIQAASYSVKYLKGSFDAFFSAFTRLVFSYDKIKHLMSRFQDKPILQIGNYSYYLTNRFSGEDFAQFLLSSLKSEATTEGDNLKTQTQETDNINGFAGALSRGLNAIRLSVNGIGNGYLNSTFDHFINLGVTWIPGKIQNMDTAQGIDLQNMMSLDDLPKILHKTVIAVRDTWEKSDASILFDQMDDLKVQYDSFVSIQSDWNNFWSSLDDPSRQLIHDRATQFEAQVPVVTLNVNSKPDFEALKQWYHSSADSLQTFVNQTAQDYPNDPLLQSLPALYSNSEAWINLNLW